MIFSSRLARRKAARTVAESDRDTANTGLLMLSAQLSELEQRLDATIGEEHAAVVREMERILTLIGRHTHG